MASLTRWVLAHKKTVVLTWVVLTIAGMAAAGPASEALDPEFSVPGKEGWETNVEIAAGYDGTGGETSPLLPVVTLPKGESVDSPGVESDLAAVDARLKRALPHARMASYASTGDRTFVSEDGRTTFAIVYPLPDPDSVFGENPRAEKAARAALDGAAVGGAPVRLTGFDALAEDSGEGDDGPGVLVETMLGGFGALLVLAFVFASFLALVPLLIAIVSILTTFLLLLGLTELTSISPIVQFLVALVGLGVAIDYSLIVVTRWREETAHGRSGDEAVQRAMETAGRAVLFSGITVAIGLFALIALPLPFLRSMGYGGMLIPLVSTATATTLAAGGAGEVRTASRLAPSPYRRQGVARLDALGRSGGAAPLARRRRRHGDGAGAGLRRDRPAARHLRRRHGGEVRRGQEGPGNARARRGRRGGAAPARGPGRRRDRPRPPRHRTGLGRVASTARSPPAARNGTAAAARSSRRCRWPTRAPTGRSDARGCPRVAHASGPDVRVGGKPASNSDFIDAVYGSFPLMIALIAITTFILLARAFRSLLLPLKAILLNILSVAAAWGVLVLVWQHGYGSEAIWGIEATGSIPSWMPLMIFAFLFGLSMDYEVFILSRMREEYDRTGSTEAAVISGLGRTGRLVTSAALILFLSFVAMASGPGTELKMFATGLGAGILLDATVIRALIVPAVIALMGRWNWWLPRWPARLLRVEEARR